MCTDDMATAHQPDPRCCMISSPGWSPTSSTWNGEPVAYHLARGRGTLRPGYVRGHGDQGGEGANRVAAGALACGLPGRR
jgi:hypothetical protein